MMEREVPEMKRGWLRFLWLLPVFALVAVVVLLPRFLPETETPAPRKAVAMYRVTGLPPGAQVLFYPLQTGTVVAGFQNPEYRAEKGFSHFGLDITPVYAVPADVLASGAGRVLGAEWCDNSLGNIAIIRYNDVYNPTTRKTADLIARYYHMVSVTVKEGDAVAAGTKIGEIDGGHPQLNHTHIELDSDTEFPFHTPQVAESSSKLLQRHPATGESILNPVSVLVLRDGQKITLHPKATFCTRQDSPRFCFPSYPSMK